MTPAVKDVVRKTWLDGLFDAVLAEFNRLLEARGETHPRGPVTKLFEDAVDNVIKEPFALELFSGSSVADDRLDERNIFALGVLSGQRLLERGLSIVRETWLGGLFDGVLAEFNRLFDERELTHSYRPVNQLFTNAVENVINESFRLKGFSGISTAEDYFGARNIFALGALAGQRLLKLGTPLIPVPDPGELQ